SLLLFSLIVCRCKTELIRYEPSYTTADQCSYLANLQPPFAAGVSDTACQCLRELGHTWHPHLDGIESIAKTVAMASDLHVNVCYGGMGGLSVHSSVPQTLRRQRNFKHCISHCWYSPRDNRLGRSHVVCTSNDPLNSSRVLGHRQDAPSCSRQRQCKSCVWP